MQATRARAQPDCRPLLADADDLTVVFQPIVDLTTATIAGYETSSRFPGTAGPDVWFAAAAEAGVAAELQALAVAKALDALPLLPGGTFLTVTVSAGLLGSPALRGILTGSGNLRGLVVALTVDAAGVNPETVRQQVAALRGCGAAVGAHADGRTSLEHLTALRPDLLLLAPSLLNSPGEDGEPTLVETLDGFAGRLGTRVVARGVEDPAQLTAVARLGLTMAHGWLLGPATQRFAPLDARAVDLARTTGARARRTGRVTELVRPVRQAGIDDVAALGVPPVVLLGRAGEPVGLLLADPRSAEVYRAPVSLLVAPSAGISETLQRALARPPAHRFDPVLCATPSDVLGLLRIDDLAAAAG